MAKESLRWGTERRLEFIELQLCWEREVNRQDLAETFGTSLQQASADFAPQLTIPSASRYLSHLWLVGDGVMDADRSGQSGLPEFDLVPGPTRRIDAGVLQAVVAAIWNKHEIEVSYQSMSHPEPERRWIGPHALAWDGFRWHARSWCPKIGAFKDVVLARMGNPGGIRPGTADVAQEQHLILLNREDAMAALSARQDV